MSAFQFTPENQEELENILTRYPNKRAALLPVLHLVQHQEGYVSGEAEAYVAGQLDLPVVDVREVLSFYSLFFTKPMGKHHIRVCNSLTCWLRGSLQIAREMEDNLGVPSGNISDDGQFSWEVVPDCLGACEIAPMLQLDKDYFGKLKPDGVEEILQQARQEER